MAYLALCSNNDYTNKREQKTDDLFFNDTAVEQQKARTEHKKRHSPLEDTGVDCCGVNQRVIERHAKECET